jgi:hypothetical protein
MIEGVSFGTALIFETMRANGFSPNEVVICGGCTRSDLWMQIHADTAGLPLVLTEVADAPALGSAILAAVGAGCYNTLIEASDAMVRAVRRASAERVVLPSSSRRRINASKEKSASAPGTWEAAGSGPGCPGYGGGPAAGAAGRAVGRHRPPPIGAISLLPAGSRVWVRTSGRRDELSVYLEPGLVRHWSPAQKKDLLREMKKTAKALREQDKRRFTHKVVARMPGLAHETVPLASHRIRIGVWTPLS